MTFSILTFDKKTGVFAGAAATGNLCVGGWVLRGDIESGLCASQGTSPSTLWRDEALRRMYASTGATQTVQELTMTDTGRDHRQLSVMDRSGTGAAFTGSQSVPYAGHVIRPGVVAAGNMISSAKVLTAMAKVFQETSGAPQTKILMALNAARAEGSDVRGLQSAALLVLAPDRPPLDLRIDDSATPLEDLAALASRTAQSPYADWLAEVPVVDDPYRAPQKSDKPASRAR